ncbi:hypothetical protein I4U23_011313 [Adineta vaga]|nr:hypothetical protein I4U23_011313 [Adineta vaga]
MANLYIQLTQLRRLSSYQYQNVFKYVQSMRISLFIRLTYAAKQYQPMNMNKKNRTLFQNPIEANEMVKLNILKRN